MAEARRDGIEGEANAGQVGARAVGAGRRLARMEAWMAGLVGAGAPVSVEVTDREPERILAWRANGASDGRARIAIELAEEGGFGTSV